MYNIKYIKASFVFQVIKVLLPGVHPFFSSVYSVHKLQQSIVTESIKQTLVIFQDES